MSLKLKTPPTLSVISSICTLAEAKAHCRVDHSDEDIYIGTLIEAAISYLDGFRGQLGRCIGEQTWELYLDTFPVDNLLIDLGPLIAVDSVEYLDPVAGIYTTMPDSGYYVDAQNVDSWIVPNSSWPTPMSAANAVRVTFRAGFAAPNNPIPAGIKHLVKLLVGTWYEKRESIVIGETVSDVPLSAKALIEQWKVFRVY
ncbi:MAG: head-tail connector protein [Rhizobiaceae bacterium]